jgi:hypothetical protein
MLNVISLIVDLKEIIFTDKDNVKWVKCDFIGEAEYPVYLLEGILYHQPKNVPNGAVEVSPCTKVCIIDAYLNLLDTWFPPTCFS